MTHFSEYEHCTLCPRNCGVNRTQGERGFCGAGDQIEIVRAALHEWEEPVISGSSGSGAIFFAHCTLGCVYCQNAFISRASSQGSVVSVQELSEIMLNLQGQGALNINLVSPTHYAPSLKAAILQAREAGLDLPIVWNTSGYETEDAIKSLKGFVDVYLTDFKYCDAGLARTLSQASTYPTVAMKALQRMIETTQPITYDVYNQDKRLISGVVVRHLLLPQQGSDSRRVVSVLADMGSESFLLSLMNQYTPVLKTQAFAGSSEARALLERFPALATTVSPDEYNDLLDFADTLFEEGYFYQEGETCLEEFIPDFTQFAHDV